ncbi:CDP-glycerol glycerophosphotransferase family protein, partial [Microbacterium sp.]
MASFSFGAGNARKLASLPLYALGRVATVLIPRRRDSWVFGCGVGIADGALALWNVAVADGHPAVWLVGSAREARDAADRGMPYAGKRSLRGFWLTARARIVVVTHGFGDVNRYGVSGAFIVQLWHGIPLKRIGLDSAETVRSGILPRSKAVRAILRRMYRGAARRIHVLPAASHLVRGRLESAFGLPDERVPVTGEPRVDVLSLG